MRLVDPPLELVACGSSSAEMPTFGSWERTVLEHTYPYVDYISCHAYYQEHDGDLACFLGLRPRRWSSSSRPSWPPPTTSRHTLHARNRSPSPSTSGTSGIRARQAPGPITDEWPVAPRLLEDVYSAADAVVVGSLLITLLKHATGCSASLAQLVNVIAPIMTEPGGIAWRQSIFYPFATTSRLARGNVLAPRIDSPRSTTSRQGNLALVDSVATYDPEGAAGAYFLVNRSPDEPVMVEITSDLLAETAEGFLLHEEDPYTINSLTAPDEVVLRTLALDIDGDLLTVVLPPAAWAAIAFTAEASRRVPAVRSL